MATATTHIASVGGYAGPTRVFRLDPPAQLNGEPAEFVSVCITPSFGGMSAEVRTYPAHENGAPRGHSLHRRAGSFTLHETPDSDAYVNGCYFMALQLLGDYTHQEASE